MTTVPQTRTKTVLFAENDMIVDVEPIDKGWMFGTVRRTSLRGMLPSNFVERLQ
jgi:hypothetical protein